MKNDNIISCLKSDLARLQLAIRIAEQLKDVLDDEVLFSPTAIFWIYAKSRENLTALMTLAPRWSKSYQGDGIDYAAMIDGIEVTLKASGEALPGTCRMVEVEVAVEAQPERFIPAIPAHTEMRKVIKCEGMEKQEGA